MPWLSSLFPPLNPPMSDWRERAVWIVGASSGIGRAVAERLAAEGARVAVSARQAVALAQFVAERPRCLALPLDITDAPAVAAAAERLQREFGGLDLVVCCAGTYTAMRADRFELATAVQHVRVNQEGALHVLGAVLPVLLAQRRGHLSLVASVAAYRGLPQALAYGPTKAALNNLAEVLYLDLARHGIGVSVVNPGFVETPLTAGNPFRMPALISADTAAREMLAGWARGEFELHFPKRFTRVLKLLRWLPMRAYAAVIRRATGL